MGASGWSYFVPYDPDPNRALEALRWKVFRAGDYAPVELGMIAPQIAIGVGGAVTADGESQVW